MIRTPFIIAATLLSTFMPAAYACMWDYDTLAMERKEFPNTLELITGKFLRHSPAFYEWRVQDRESRLKNEPDNLALFDDLAVAHDKLGHHDKAIEIMLKKEKVSPGLYETYANLGTFYIHAGRLEEGVAMIEKAIEINPDAHFGREVYQKHLANYVLSKKVDGETRLPLQRIPEYPSPELLGFAWHIATKEIYFEDAYSWNLTPEDQRKAIKGILGMMRFGNYDSPVLLEALGDLLLRISFEEDSKHLAARAYLKASYEAKDPVAKENYRQLANSSLHFQSGVDLDKLESIFQDELAEADEWYAQIEQDEATWIAEGKNLDSAFTAKYYDEPLMSGKIGGFNKSPQRLAMYGLVIFFIVCTLGPVMIVLLFKRTKKAKRGTH